MMNALGALILYNDADGASPIEELARLEESMNRGADVAIGSRALHSDETAVRTIFIRKAMGRVFNGLVNLLLLPQIADTQCGFKLFRRSVARELFSRQRADGFSFDVEILFLARRLNFVVKEVPINWTNIPGSKVNLVKDSTLMFLDVVRFRLRDLFGGYGDLTRKA
jgi:dolichyl-phosphate beta-glucosyltransferase